MIFPPTLEKDQATLLLLHVHMIDQNWPFKKKIEILLLLFSKGIVLLKFKVLKPMPLYTINLTGIENLIEVIMISLVSCQCFLRLVFNVLCQVLNPLTPQNPENFNPIKVN